MANPIATGSGPDVRKKKEARKELEKSKIEVSLYPPSRAIEFQFYQDFPNAKYVTWAQGRFVEASFLDGDVLKVAYYEKTII